MLFIQKPKVFKVLENVCFEDRHGGGEEVEGGVYELEIGNTEVSINSAVLLIFIFYFPKKFLVSKVITKVLKT